MAAKKQNGERRGQRGSQAFTRCGFDDRAVAVEFQHIGLREFNRACERFLEEREPNYAKTQIRRGGRGGKPYSAEATKGKTRDASFEQNQNQRSA